MDEKPTPQAEFLLACEAIIDSNKKFRADLGQLFSIATTRIDNMNSALQHIAEAAAVLYACQPPREQLSKLFALVDPTKPENKELLNTLQVAIKAHDAFEARRGSILGAMHNAKNDLLKAFKIPSTGAMGILP